MIGDKIRDKEKEGKFDQAFIELARAVYIKNDLRFEYKNEIKFHLAIAYLKTGQRKKAKTLLNELISTKSNVSDQAEQTLEKMRWF